MEPFWELRRMHRNSENVSTKQERIATLARQSPEMGFTSLAYLMDIEWLHEAYRRTRKDGAVGVDGQTSAEYERDLEGNLRSLLDRAKSGRYFAPPVRRVYIPGSPPEKLMVFQVPGLRSARFQALLAIGRTGGISSPIPRWTGLPGGWP
jgi:hypothetical protein